MIDVFVRMAATPAQAGVVAESVRWAAGSDPSGPRHQVVTLFGDPTVTHLAWALAAANRGHPDALWKIGADGSAVTGDVTVGNAMLRDDAASLLSRNGPQLRTAIAHLASVRGQEQHSAAIRVPISLLATTELDADAMLASLREAEGEVYSEPTEDEIAA